MYELRILNGLHRGATLPLDLHTITLGAGDHADVVMADHGIADEHAMLVRTEQGWLLSATGGPIYSAAQHQPLTVLELDAGAFARVGDIWLMIAAENAHWQAPPAMPEADDFDARAALEGEAAGVAKLAADDEDDERPAKAPPAGSGEDAPERAGKRLPPRRRRLRIALAAVATVTMLGGAAAYALTTKPAPPGQRPSPSVDLGPDRGAQAARPPRQSSAPAADAAPAVALPPSPAELAKLFRKRLSDAELLNRFDLALEDRSWSMKAQLDDEETARFERILTSFIKEHQITFPVSAKAVTAEAMLPFKIGQVITGADPTLVTQDGARLHVGDDYRGVRVVAIQQNRLTFFGKRKIDVNW